MCIRCGNPWHFDDVAAASGDVVAQAPSVHLDPGQAGVQITRHGYHWGSTIGAAVGPISFGFRQSAPTSTSYSAEITTFTQFTSAEKVAAETALRLWSNVANITFTEVNAAGYTNSATILLANYNTPGDGAQAYAYYPSSGNQSFSSAQGDVWVNRAYENVTSLPFGSYDYIAILHELGHSVGLEHPGDYNAGAGQTITYANSAAYYEDTRQYSVMSYFSASYSGANHTYNGKTYYSSTPLLDDIAAIQRLYGSNTSFATGNTVYGFNSNADAAYQISSASQQTVCCVWDGGGNDTLDFSGYATNQTIDLRAGNFSSVGALTSNVSIAIGTTIENAIGGSGSDTIYGNSVANVLRGGGSNDTIYGNGGADTVVFSGRRADYAETRLSAASWSIRDTRAGSPDGTDTLYDISFLQFSDSTQSILNIPPVVAATGAAVPRNSSVAVTSLFSVTDANGDAITAYRFWDSTTSADSGYFSVAGVRQGTNVNIDVPAAQLAQTQFVTVTAADDLWVQVYDGSEWSSWLEFFVTPPVNHAPTVSVSNILATRGQVLAGASLYAAADIDGDAIAKIQFWDSTAASGSGSFYVNGVARPVNVAIDVGASSIGNTVFNSGAGTDQLWVRVSDGSLWSDWASFTVTGPVNSAPVVTASSVNVSKGALLEAFSLFTVSDANNDAMTGYEFWDSTSAAGSGYWTVNSAIQGTNQSIVVAAADLANTKFQATAGTDSLYVRATDGIAFSDWKAFSVTAANLAPVIVASDKTLAAGTFAASFLFSVTDGDGDAMTGYQLYDGTAGNSGFFAVNGATQNANTTISVSASQLASTTFETGTGSDILWFRATDGTTWSEWKSITVTEPAAVATPNNHAPTVSVTDKAATHGQMFAGGTLYSAADIDGDTITRVEFWDSTASASSGHFIFNGQESPANAAIGVAVSQINNIAFQAGAGTDQLWGRVYDGSLWSDWKSFTVSAPPNTAPVATPANQSLTFNQTVAASSLFSVTDADNDQIVKYEFWDSTAGAVSGHFAIGGIEQGANQAIEVLAANLNTASFVAGSATATDLLWVRASDGIDWSDWKQFSVVTSSP